MSFNFIHFFIFWKFLVPLGGTAGPLATPLVAKLLFLKFYWGVALMHYGIFSREKQLNITLTKQFLKHENYSYVYRH